MAMADWFDLARESVLSPRTGARRVLRLNVSLPVLWQALVLAAVVDDLLVILSLVMAGQGPDALSVLGAPGPLGLALMQALSLVLMALALHYVGRAFGGTGDWPGALALVIWLQVILLGLQAAQLVLLLVMPFLANLLGLASIALLFWLLTQFAMELHGFRRAGRVFAVTLASFVVVGLLFVFLLVAAGLYQPQGI